MYEYNEQQQALIDAPFDVPVIGVAAAGGGKTTTMVGRIQRAVRVCPEGKILAVTFTNKAAQELRERLTKTLTEMEMRRVIVGTFHSVIGQIIRQNAEAVGLSAAFSMLDESSSDQMYVSIIDRMIAGDDERAVAIRKVLEKLIPARYSPKTKDDIKNGVVTVAEAKREPFNKTELKSVAHDISAFVNLAHPTELLINPDGSGSFFTAETMHKVANAIDYLREKGDRPDRRDNTELVFKYLVVLRAIFNQAMVESSITNTLSYDQVLFLGYLISQEELGDEIAKQFAHVIIDEYQDTNALQDILIDKIAGNNVTVVGDVDQSIYAWRGGRPELMEWRAQKSQVYHLPKNYRSYAPILELGNNIIQHNKLGASIRQPMIADRMPDNGFRGVVSAVFEDDTAEAEHIVERIKFLHEQGMEYKDIAILVRSRLVMPKLNLVLGQSQLPVNDTTKFADFMKSEVVADVMNFLKVFTNPKDVYAFMATLDRPKRGIGPVLVDKIQEGARQKELGVIEYLLLEETAKDFTPKQWSKITEYTKVYNDILTADHKVTFGELYDMLVEDTGYIDWVKDLKTDSTRERNLENLETLKEMALEFEDEYASMHTNYSLFDVANAFVIEMTSTTRQEDKDGVCISTVHGAKGLEWRYVIILGCEQESYPGTKAETEEDIEGERRLMYVAVTRARDGLLFTWAKNRLTMNSLLSRSSFLSEMGIPREDDIDPT